MPPFVLRQGRRYLRMDQFDPHGGSRHMKIVARQNNRDPQQLARRWARQIVRRVFQDTNP